MPERDSIEVLVVDDDLFLRLDMSDRLRRRGFSVFRASNAEQAIKVMEKRPSIATVLSDLELPGPMGGLELLHVISQRWPGRRLLLISGYSAPSEHDMPSGTRFLSKPVTPARLDGALQDLVRIEFEKGREHPSGSLTANKGGRRRRLRAYFREDHFSGGGPGAGTKRGCWCFGEV